MKKLLILFLIFLNASFVFPASYKLHVKLKDGTKLVYKVADITKIDFSGLPTGTEGIQKFQHIVKSFKLMQNYPNPFNPSTKIQYEIPDASKIEISIYDMNGRLIKTIVNEHQQAGSYRVIWDGMNKSGNKVSSGVYVYTVKFGNIVSSKKMMFLK